MFRQRPADHTALLWDAGPFCPLFPGSQRTQLATGHDEFKQNQRCCSIHLWMKSQRRGFLLLAVKIIPLMQKSNMGYPSVFTNVN